MATEVGVAYLSIVPSASGFGASLQRQVGGSVASTGTAMGKESSKRYKSAFLGGLKGMATGIGAFLALDKTVQFFSGAIEEAREAEKVGSRTANVIKSTGKAAGVTAKQVADLAESLSNKVGQDDEAIQSGANLLLTFKNIRDEAGKGNDIFDQTTGLMVDMSTAMGQDMKSSAIQLGKALNDPTKGISALSRVGVTFSAGQEKQIKHLQKTGDLMGAQKVILKELKSEFGGAGKAMADPADRAQVAWGNLKEDVGTAIMPQLNRLANWFTEDGLPGIRRFAKKYGPDIKEFGQNIWDAAEDMGPAVKTTLPILAGVLGDVATSFGKFAKAFSSLPKPLQTAIVTTALTGYGIRKLTGGRGGAGGLAPPVILGGGAAAGAAGGAAAAGTAATTASRVGNVASRAPLATVAAVTFGFPAIDRTVDKYLDDSNVHDFTSNLKLMESGLANFNDKVFGILPGKTGIDEAKEELGALDQKIAALAASGHLPKARALFNKLAESAKADDVSMGVLREHMPKTVTALNAGGRAAGGIAKQTRDADKAGQALFDMFRTNLIPSTQNLADKYDLSRKEARNLRGAISDTTGTAKEHEKQLREVADKLGLDERQTRDLIKAYKDIPKSVDTRADFLTAEAERKRDTFLTQTKGKFSDLGNQTYAIMVNGQSGHGRVFATGGFVSGPGGPRSDSISARLSNGEFVVNADATRKNRDLLESINSKRFADGGIVGRTNTKVNLNLSALQSVVAETLKSLRSSAASGGMTAQQVACGLAFARSQVGDPYVWGGVGPNGYDCSGFQSAVFNAARGLNPYHRLGSTGTMPWPHMAPGKGGAYQIGWFTGNPGHTAGTLGGVNVESRGGEGVVVGPNARGANDSLFNRHAHFTTAAGRSIPVSVGTGDPAFTGAGGKLSGAERWIISRESGGRVTANNPSSSAFGLGQLLDSNRVAYAKRLGLNWHKEMGDTGTTDYGSQLAMMRMYIKDRYGTAANAKHFWQRNGYYDQGGVLKPGFTMAYNGTGRDEYVSKEPPRRHRGPIRIELDIGGRRTLTGVIRDEVNGELDFESTTGRMR